jgi:hypothetical protein
MSATLVIEHLDVIEQRHLGVTVTGKSLSLLFLHGREEALHHRIVVAVAAATHAAGDTLAGEIRLVVFARVGAATIRVMQEPRIRAATRDRHLERLQRQPSIVNGADRPAHDEARKQIEHRRQIELGTVADDELRRVADPALIRRGRGEVSGENIGGDRIIVIAIGRALEPFRHATVDLLVPHQAPHALFAYGFTVFFEVLRAAINWGRFQDPPLLSTTPFHRFGVSIKAREETKRDRRIHRDEEQALLAACLTMNAAEHKRVGPAMHDRIIGALETCCRQGEMLRIQNRHVDWEQHQLVIPGANTKDAENRRVPFDPQGRLAPVLKRRAALGP